jgi:hypothetical protein
VKIPAVQANTPFARLYAVWLFLATLLVAAPLRAQQLAAAGHLPALTRVADIRRLTADEANRGYPVRLQAVVTYFAAHNPNLLPGERYSQLPAPDMFIQDSTAGIFVNVPRAGRRIPAGRGSATGWSVGRLWRRGYTGPPSRGVLVVIHGPPCLCRA